MKLNDYLSNVSSFSCSLSIVEDRRNRCGELSSYYIIMYTYGHTIPYREPIDFSNGHLLELTVLFIATVPPLRTDNP